MANAKKAVRRLSKEIDKDVKLINQSILQSDLGRPIKRLDKDIRKIDKKFDKEVKEVEKWVIERRKFFIKLGWLIVLVICLLIASGLLMVLV